jgi:hypothetical protein
LKNDVVVDTIKAVLENPFEGIRVCRISWQLALDDQLYDSPITLMIGIETLEHATWPRNMHAVCKGEE